MSNISELRNSNTEILSLLCDSEKWVQFRKAKNPIFSNLFLI